MKVQSELKVVVGFFTHPYLPIASRNISIISRRKEAGRSTSTSELFITFVAFSKIVCYICSNKKNEPMGYDINDKMEWTVIFILEFGRRFGLTMKQAFGYLSRYKAIDYIDRHYGYVHTQSFASVIDDMAEFCRRKGGELA